MTKQEARRLAHAIAVVTCNLAPVREELEVIMDHVTDGDGASVVFSDADIAKVEDALGEISGRHYSQCTGRHTWLAELEAIRAKLDPNSGDTT